MCETAAIFSVFLRPEFDTFFMSGKRASAGAAGVRALAFTPVNGGVVLKGSGLSFYNEPTTNVPPSRSDD